MPSFRIVLEQFQVNIKKKNTSLGTTHYFFLFTSNTPSICLNSTAVVDILGL